MGSGCQIEDRTDTKMEIQMLQSVALLLLNKLKRGIKLQPMAPISTNKYPKVAAIHVRLHLSECLSVGASVS